MLQFCIFLPVNGESLLMTMVFIVICVFVCCVWMFAVLLSAWANCSICRSVPTTFMMSCGNIRSVPPGMLMCRVPRMMDAMCMLYRWLSFSCDSWHPPQCDSSGTLKSARCRSFVRSCCAYCGVFCWFVCVCCCVFSRMRPTSALCMRWVRNRSGRESVTKARNVSMSITRNGSANGMDVCMM